MDKSFNSLFKFNESAIRKNINNFTFHKTVNRISFLNINPRIIKHLFYTEGNAFFIIINPDYHNIYFTVKHKYFAWMINSSPFHIGKMKKSVNSIKIDERTEISNVFNHTFNHIANSNLFKEFAFMVSTFFIKQFAT